MTLYDGDIFVDRQLAFGCCIQTHINHTDGLYVNGLRFQELRQGRGMGSMANHADTSNAKTVRIGDQVVLVATKAISANEEVTLTYGARNSDSYKVAMGEKRWTSSPDADGKACFTCVPILVRDGQIERIHASDEMAALRQLCDAHLLDAINPSAKSHACFLRCVAIALRDLWNRGSIVGDDHRQWADSYLQCVDVDGLCGGQEDLAGTTRMRGIKARYVTEVLVHYWDNLFDPLTEETIGDTLMAARTDDLPEGVAPRGSRLVARAPGAAGPSAEAAAATPAEKAAAAARAAAEEVAALVNGRSADCGVLSMRVISYMLGVDVQVYDIVSSAT